MRFSAVYRVGGSKSLPLFTPETGGGHARKIAVSNGVMKYSAGFIGITEERNQSYGDASVDWKTPVCFVPLPLYLKIRLKRKL